MKYFLLYPLLFLAACGVSTEKSSGPFEVKGEVKNLGAQTVYLMVKKVAPDGHIYWPKVDSAQVDAGRFILQRDTSIVEPSAAMLVYLDENTKKQKSLKFTNPYEHKTTDQFIMENTEISINGDINETTGISLKGSKETDFSYKYDYALLRRLMVQNFKIDSIIKTKKLGVEEEKVEREKWRAPEVQAFKEIIATYRNLYGALRLVHLNQYVFSVTELEEFCGLFDQKLLDSTTGKELLKSISLRKSKEKMNQPLRKS